MAPRPRKATKRAYSSSSRSQSRSSKARRPVAVAKRTVNRRPGTAPAASRRTRAELPRRGHVLDAMPPPHGGIGGLPSFGFPGDNPPDIQPERIDLTMTLDKVGGLEEQVKYLNRRILTPLTAGSPKTEMGKAALKPVKGVIFYGPPGTGKTMLAKSLASTLTTRLGKRVTFFMRKGTDVYSKYVGESERNLRTLFQKAHSMSPSIIFLDEIDGLCPVRREGLDNLHHTVSVTVSLLGLMDTVKPGEVFVIGATNRLSSLDPAMLRPGRFDHHLYFSAPNEAGRLSILNIKLADWGGSKPNAEILQELARSAVGYTGADLVKLIDRAVDIAVERQFPNFGSLNDKTPASCLDNLQVTREDWRQALATTHKSNPNVFDNSSFTGEVMNESVRPLIEGIVQEIRSKVQDYTTEVDVCLGNKGVLVWAPTDSALLDIDNLLFPAVIGMMDNRKFPAFHLSLFSEKGVLAQALASASEKPTILVIPRIDYFCMILRTKNMEKFFLEKFEQARGKNLTILASAVCGVSNLPEGLQRLFQDKEMSYKLRSVTTEERTAFFSPLFSGSSKYHGKYSTKQLTEFLKTTVDITANDEIGKLTTLHGQLTNACTRYFERGTGRGEHGELMDKFADILNTYAQSNGGACGHP